MQFICWGGCVTGTIEFSSLCIWLIPSLHCHSLWKACALKKCIMCTCFMFKGKIDQWVHYESIIKFPITFHPVILAATDDGWFDSVLSGVTKSWISNCSFCVHYPEFFYSRGSQECGPQPTALVLPDNLWEMQMHGLYPRSTSEVICIGTSSLCFIFIN